VLSWDCFSDLSRVGQTLFLLICRTRVCLVFGGSLTRPSAFGLPPCRNHQSKTKKMLARTTQPFRGCTCVLLGEKFSHECAKPVPKNAGFATLFYTRGLPGWWPRVVQSCFFDTEMSSGGGFVGHAGEKVCVERTRSLLPKISSVWSSVLCMRAAPRVPAAAPRFFGWFDCLFN